jgi:hypothetical protein
MTMITELPFQRRMSDEKPRPPEERGKRAIRPMHFTIIKYDILIELTSTSLASTKVEARLFYCGEKEDA